MLHPDLQRRFTHAQFKDDNKFMRRYLAIMNNETLWIISVRIPNEGTPNLVVLYEFINPNFEFRFGKFTNSCCFGHGYMKKHNSKVFEDKILLVASWG